MPRAEDPFHSNRTKWRWMLLDEWTQRQQREAFRVMHSAEFRRMKSFRRTLETIRGLPEVPETT